MKISHFNSFYIASTKQHIRLHTYGQSRVPLWNIWCSKCHPFCKKYHIAYTKLWNNVRLTCGQSRVPLWSMMFKMMSILQRYITLLTRNSQTIYHFDLWSITGTTLKYDIQNDVHFRKIYYTAYTKQWNNISFWLLVNHGCHFEVCCSKCCPFRKDITLLPGNNEWIYQIACVPFGEALWVPLEVPSGGCASLDARVESHWGC